MKGKCDMKNILGFLIGFIVFEIIYAGIEYIVVNMLGMHIIFLGVLKENFIKGIFIYLGICILLYILNYLHSCIIAKKLNQKVDLIKNKKEDK